MIWLICNFLPFYAHVHTCSPSYTAEELKTNVDSETVCLRLLIKGLIVPIRLCILSIAYYYFSFCFAFFTVFDRFSVFVQFSRFGCFAASFE